MGLKILEGPGGFYIHLAEELVDGEFRKTLGLWLMSMGMAKRTLSALGVMEFRLLFRQGQGFQHPGLGSEPLVGGKVGVQNTISGDSRM
jgi:hypothetical protein